MQLNDQQRIDAPRELVWAALNDPEVLRKCIPGCDRLDMTSPAQMTATVTLKVGPVKASFSGSVALSDLDPPNGYRISGEGAGGVAGFAKGGADVRLEALDQATTLLHYTVDAQIGGKLAQLGGRLINSTAKKLAGEFFDRLSRELAPAPEYSEVEAHTAKESVARKGLGLISRGFGLLGGKGAKESDATSGPD